jgi:hybrid cluster-associated redox disulfide protein
MKITKDTLISEALKINPKAAEILMKYGMGCLGCPSSQMESLAQAAEIHGLELKPLLEELNKDLQ